MSIVQPQSAPKTTAKKKRLFPMNLTPFEDYMVWDERPGYPMTYVVRWEFRGQVNRSALQESLELALERHPLLVANVRPAKGGRDCWVAGAKRTIEIDWGKLDDPIEPAGGEAIDIRNQAGLRIWARFDQDTLRLTLQYHHATTDGIGSSQFMGDWLWYYAKLVGDPIDDSLPETSAAQLRGRGRESFDGLQFAGNNLEKAKLEARNFGLSCLPNSVRVAAPRRASAPRPADWFPGVRDLVFEKAEYRSIRKAAERRGQSTNELLIERLLVSIRNWNVDNRGQKRGKICVMMPMDLRDADTQLATAANVVSYGLIRREFSDCVESEELIDSIRNEMVHLKHSRQCTPFMNALAYLQLFPNRLMRWFVGTRALATAIVSNTGDPTKRFAVSFPREGGLVRAGNLVLTDLGGVPPLRRGTRMTVSIFTYRRALKICMRCDPRYFSGDATEQFLEHYAGSIRTLIA